MCIDNDDAMDDLEVALTDIGGIAAVLDRLGERYAREHEQKQQQEKTIMADTLYNRALAATFSLPAMAL